MDTNYVVTDAVTVRKRDRPALAVSLQVFSLVLLNRSPDTHGGCMPQKDTANVPRASIFM